jgi:hypothetical protein
VGCDWGPPSYYCRSAKDDCVNDEDCKKGQRCVYSKEVAHWACEAEPQCPVG